MPPDRGAAIGQRRRQARLSGEQLDQRGHDPLLPGIVEVLEMRIVLDAHDANTLGDLGQYDFDECQPARRGKAPQSRFQHVRFRRRLAVPCGPSADEADQFRLSVRVGEANGRAELHRRQAAPVAIAGDEVHIASSVTESHGDALSYRFSGKLSGDTMSGGLDLGEYLNATWTAKRHVSRG